MKGWADLNKAIFQIKREHGVDDDHIIKLLKHELKMMYFRRRLNEISRLSQIKANNS